MRTLRTAVTAIVVVLMCAGYAASQYFYFSGRFEQYALKVDQPQVRTLALVLLALMAVLAVWRDRELSP